MTHHCGKTLSRMLRALVGKVGVRGREPVEFVGRIRRYFEILVKLEQRERDSQRNYAIDLVAPAI